jgi:hypothetical protein
MLSGLGAFAGGLSDGMRLGQDMKLRQQYIDEQKKSNARDAELHQARMDAINLHREKRNRLRAANDEITAGWDEYPAAQLAPPITAGLSDIAKKTPVPANPRGTGLSSGTRQASREAGSSDELIGKRILTGNLLDDPAELTRMANVYKKHGVLDEMGPWMNEVYAAKKKGIPKALHLLLIGDGKGAAEVLRKGGIKLLDDPVRNNSDDPLSNSWSFKFEGGGEKDIDVRAIARKFFPGDYSMLRDKIR